MVWGGKLYVTNVCMYAALFRLYSGRVTQTARCRARRRESVPNKVSLGGFSWTGVCDTSEYLVQTHTTMSKRKEFREGSNKKMPRPKLRKLSESALKKTQTPPKSLGIPPPGPQCYVS